MSTLLDLMKAVGGMMAVMVVWLAVQTLVRRRSGCGRDQDVLNFMAHGCAGCRGDGACKRKADKELPHESARI